MDNVAALEAQKVQRRLSEKINEINAAAQTQLAPVNDHIAFTLQQAYFKCAYDCFDRRRKQEEISNCVENCSVPVLNAQNHLENEMNKLQERLSRAIMVCQDKFEETKLHSVGSDALRSLESCVDQSIQDSMKSVPHMVGRLKSYLSIPEGPK